MVGFPSFLPVVIVPLLVLSAPCRAGEPDERVTMVTDEEKAGGFLVRLTEAAFHAAGRQVEIQQLPWRRALSMVESGRVDGLLGCYLTAERAAYLLYTEGVAESSLNLFTLRRDEPLSFTDENGEPIVVGTILGASYPREFTALSSMRTEPAVTFEQNVAKLSHGYIGAFVEKKRVVLNYLAAHPQPPGREIVAVEPPVSVNFFYNAFLRKSPKAEGIVRDFNRGLEAIKADGTHARIIKESPHE